MHPRNPRMMQANNHLMAVMQHATASARGPARGGPGGRVGQALRGRGGRVGQDPNMVIDYYGPNGGGYGPGNGPWGGPPGYNGNGRWGGCGPYDRGGMPYRFQADPFYQGHDIGGMSPQDQYAAFWALQQIHGQPRPLGIQPSWNDPRNSTLQERLARAAQGGGELERLYIPIEQAIEANGVETINFSAKCDIEVDDFIVDSVDAANFKILGINMGMKPMFAGGGGIRGTSFPATANGGANAVTGVLRGGIGGDMQVQNLTAGPLTFEAHFTGWGTPA